MFSTMQDYSNLIGEAVERYRLEYKKLNYMRRLFFEDVENDPDFDRFTEYFKWIDSSVSYMISQIFPLSARFSNGISLMWSNPTSSRETSIKTNFHLSNDSSRQKEQRRDLLLPDTCGSLVMLLYLEMTMIIVYGREKEKRERSQTKRRLEKSS